jgi:hypothetical protein
MAGINSHLAATCPMGIRDSLPEGKAAGHATDYLLPSSTKVKNDGAVPALLHTLLWCAL